MIVLAVLAADRLLLPSLLTLTAVGLARAIVAPWKAMEMRRFHGR